MASGLGLVMGRCFIGLAKELRSLLLNAMTGRAQRMAQDLSHIMAHWSSVAVVKVSTIYLKNLDGSWSRWRFWRDPWTC